MRLILPVEQTPVQAISSIVLLFLLFQHRVRVSLDQSEGL